jgi:YHS domain-containing protein
MKRLISIIVLVLLLSGCATHATFRDRGGKDVMLSGHDPVAYFKLGSPLAGVPEVQATFQGRTYYFATPGHKATFESDPTAFEPQFGGFCSNGIPYGMKVFGDPKEFSIIDGRLYMFSDAQERAFWLLDPGFGVVKGEQMWTQIEGTPWRLATLRSLFFRVSWYRDSKMLAAEWAYQNPGKKLSPKTADPVTRLVFNPGGLVDETTARTALVPQQEPDTEPARQP